MYQLVIPISAELAEALEAFFCEEPQAHWVLYEETRLKTHELQGFFISQAEAEELQAELRGYFPALPDGVAAPLEDKDWKNAYKLHFKPWSDRGLHFVPVWERESYALPAGEVAVLLDPGMAFGTGNHETTRLCIRRLLDAREAWGEAVKSKRVVDAGCGSGILAIAAAKVGFSVVSGFDNDPDSVRISVENAALCEVSETVQFTWSGLEEGLHGRSVDLLFANILAPVLIENAELLLGTLAPKGRLALSGILRAEIDQVASHFSAVARQLWPDTTRPSFDIRHQGEWADLLVIR